MVKPEKCDIPTLRDACELDDLCGERRNEIRCCHNCKHYRTSAFASPCGWCKLYPSDVVNCDDVSVCDRFTAVR